jgi:hypothetical protein
MRTPILFFATSAAILVGACVDPVHDSTVNSLGGEVGGVPQGEYHRAGQPCGACHGTQGPAKTTFTVAGTVFFGPTKAIGVDNAQVIMVDSLNSSYTAHTNCVGNFFVTSDQWNPAFPILVQVFKDGQGQQMASHVSRAVSCSDCHKDPPYYDSPGHVHLANAAQEASYTPPACPVSPVQTGSGQ